MDVSLAPQQLQRLERVVTRYTGIRLGPEKTHLASGRLSKRLRHHGFTNFAPYLDLLESNPSADEIQALANAITTNLTRFYRENHHYEILREKVLMPYRERDRSGRGRLRIWSAGCSTGMEAYSAVMTTLDELGATPSDFLILATDIDRNALAVGERGRYPLIAEGDIPKAFFKRFCTRDAEAIEMKESLRSLVRFRALNFIARNWPMKGKFDAIFCRNALIYFERDLQITIAKRLTDLLVPGGVLFLGHSESIPGIETGLPVIGPTAYLKPGAR